MKIKPGFGLYQVGDEYIIMQDGSSNVDFSQIINLNKTSAFLWQEMERHDFDAHTLADALTAYFDVTPEDALNDAQQFIFSMQHQGLIE